MLGRRSVLGGALALPSIAKASMEGTQQNIGGAMNVPQSSKYLMDKLDAEIDWVPRQIANLRERLLNVNKEAGTLQQFLRTVSRLDPDLETNKSFSLSTRMRIQATRNLDEAIASQKGYIQRELEHLLGMNK